MIRSTLLQFAALVAVSLAGGAVGAQCVLDWADGFYAPGTDDVVRSFTVFDAGHGPALYVGGDFRTAGDAIAEYTARWNGQTWSALGGRAWGSIHAMTVYDNGSGPALYAGGGISGNLAKWNGSAWSAVGGGVSGTVYALAVFDDGSGPALYAAGHFRQTAGDLVVNNIAKWDGLTWSALGTGIGDVFSQVSALAVYDDGSGPALYAAGDFAGAGGVTAPAIARWDGTSWSALDGSLGPNYAVAYALTVYDDGHGPALYVGGWFDTAGSVSANNIARWDGTTWSALDSGTAGWPYPTVYSMTVFDDGSGPALYAGGVFDTAGGVSVHNIGRWDGTSWSPLGSGMEDMLWYNFGAVLALTVYDDGRGPALYAGGAFGVAGGVAASRIARWDGTTWSALSTGSGMNQWVRALTVLDPPGAEPPALYAGGDFTTAGAARASHVAHWDGQAWSPLGEGTDDVVEALGVFDDGAGPTLYVGGQFRVADGVDAAGIARWDGTTFQPVGGGVSAYPIYQATVRAFAVYDPPGEDAPGLYVGGIFEDAGSLSAGSIARWDGQAWSPLGSGLMAEEFGIAGVYALAVFDDGGGPALYAAGQVTLAGGIPVENVARWDGQTWSALAGGGIGGGSCPCVLALAVFDDGTGPALYAGGAFETAGGMDIPGIARWDGETWSPVGGGLDGHVETLAVIDDGSGPALYAGGRFATAGGEPANCIARWNGQRWSALGSGTDLFGGVLALAEFDDGAGPALYAGGQFLGAGGRVSTCIARWGCVPGLMIGDLNCDGRVNTLDINPFVRALCSPAAYADAYPDCDRRTADINDDGTVNNFDIRPFIDLLTRH
ncbi:MAG: hypothetical protein PVJ57_07380 [Phycisphaerae bacterium]|jgi:hypothetical protein